MPVDDISKHVKCILEWKLDVFRNMVQKTFVYVILQRRKQILVVNISTQHVKRQVFYLLMIEKNSGKTVSFVIATRMTFVVTLK